MKLLKHTVQKKVEPPKRIKGQRKKREQGARSFDASVSFEGKRVGKGFRETYPVTVQASTIVGATSRAVREGFKAMRTAQPLKTKLYEITVTCTPTEE